MRRDYFSLDVRNVDWVEEGGEPAKPSVTIEFEGPASTLRQRLTGPEGELLDAGETDVAFRLQSRIDDDDASGVVGVTNRVTGDFILELNQDAADVIQFISAAREWGKQSDAEDGHYRVTIRIDGEEVAAYDKNTLLVYDRNGNLLRHHSLIPSGVEL